jgi:hypothetical protein
LGKIASNCPPTVTIFAADFGTLQYDVIEWRAPPPFRGDAAAMEAL